MSDGYSNTRTENIFENARGYVKTLAAARAGNVKRAEIVAKAILCMAAQNGMTREEFEWAIEFAIYAVASERNEHGRPSDSED